MAQQLIYIHIPRTAGTSIREALVTQLREDCVYWYGHRNDPKRFKDPAERERLAQYRVVGGHFTRSDTKHLPGSKTYSCVVREPIVRAISMFNYCQSKSNHPLANELKGLSLLQAIESSERFRNEIANRQCAMIEGGHSGIKGAMDRLISESWIVGVNPQRVFDRVCGFLGLRPFELPSYNQGEKRGPVSTAEREAIETINGEDIRLYQFLKALEEK